MNNNRVGVLAGIVSLLGLAVQYVPSVIFERWFTGGFDDGIPMVGTAGETVVVYTAVVTSAGRAMALLLAVGLGYYASRRLDMGHEYRRFGGAVAVGSLVSIASLWAVGYGVQSSPMAASNLLVSLAVLVRMVVTISLPVTVGAFAGAALAHFRTNEQTPVQPTAVRTDDSTTGAQESPTDDADAHSETV